MIKNNFVICLAFSVKILILKNAFFMRFSDRYELDTNYWFSEEEDPSEGAEGSCEQTYRQSPRCQLT
jgi:hypothetical protein